MRWFISIVVVLALVAGLWWLEQRRQVELRPEPDMNVPAEQPEPRYPLPTPEEQPAPSGEQASEDDSKNPPDDQADPEPEPQPPLPDLADSDDAALATLSDLLGNDFTQRWVKPEFVVARTVAIVNSLDGDAPGMKTRPLKTLDTEPRTEDTASEEALLWTTANAERYDALIDTLESVPPEQAAARYARYYPLFQQAWNELGETEPHFNDRLIDIIDHLLATPEVALPFQVVPHEDRLHFADESLQEESWGRKLLVRMGPEQARRVKAWLEDFRRAASEPARPKADQ